MVSRVFCAGAISACLLVLGAPVGAADDAGALLAKHKAYVGWQDGDGGITSLRERGTVTFDGHVTAVIAAYHRGPLFRSTARYANGGRLDAGFTGRLLWSSNANGFTVQTVGDAARYVYTRSALFDERLASVPATFLRSETIDGVPVGWVHFAPQLGVPADIAFETQTGAVKRAVLDPGGRYENRFDSFGYTEVAGGKRVLSSWRYAGEKAVHAYTSVEANVPVTDEELHPPKQTATWTFDPNAGTVPIELTEHRIYISATVNGVRAKFIFDTGADGIFVTDTFARRAGAKRAGAFELEGVGGGAIANMYTVDSLAIGSNVLHSVSIGSGIDERREFDSEGAVGLIGFDLLAGAIVDMNLDDKTMRILDPQKMQPDTSKGITVRIDLETGQPRVGMTVGGKVPVLATLDSGNEMRVLFSESLVRRDHVVFFSDPDSLASRMQMIGVNGSEIDTCGRLQSLELGPVVYRPVPACFSPSQARNDVLVGLDFIRGFNIVYDYPDGYLQMIPRK